MKGNFIIYGRGFCLVKAVQQFFDQLRTLPSSQEWKLVKFKDMDFGTSGLSPSWFSLFTLIILPEARSLHEKLKKCYDHNKSRHMSEVTAHSFTANK